MEPFADERAICDSSLPVHVWQSVGRIWRVQLAESVALVRAGRPELDVTALDHANPWVRRTAHRLLEESGHAAAILPLLDGVRSAWGRIHALWLREALAPDEESTLTAIGEGVRDADRPCRPRAVVSKAQFRYGEAQFLRLAQQVPALPRLFNWIVLDFWFCVCLAVQSFQFSYIRSVPIKGVNVGSLMMALGIHFDTWGTWRHLVAFGRTRLPDGEAKVDGSLLT